MEKIISKRLAWQLEKKNLLPETVEGYRPNWETSENVAVAAFETCEAFQRKEETLMVVLDIENAYNRVQYSMLLLIMLEMGIEMWVIKWTGSAEFSRIIAPKCKTWTSQPIQIFSGTPIITNTFKF